MMSTGTRASPLDAVSTEARTSDGARLPHLEAGRERLHRARGRAGRPWRLAVARTAMFWRRLSAES